MKIKLTINTDNKIENQFNNLDVSYGFTHWSSQYPALLGEKDRSFSVKIIKVLNALLNINKKRTNEQQEEIVHHIGKSLDYMADFLPERILNGLNTQINLNTEANKLGKKIYQYINDNIVTLSHDFSDKLDTEQARIYIQKNLIVIGEESLKSYPELLEKHGVGLVAQNVLFHEIGHALERTNEKKYGRKENPLTQLMVKSSHVMFRKHGNKEAINQFIENNTTTEYTKIDELLWTNLNILSGEMYADLTSILMLRNVELQEKSFDINKIKSMTEILSSERFKNYQRHKLESEHLKGIIGFENLTREIECDRFDSFLPENMFNIVRNSRHLTSAALNSLSSKIDNLGDKVLTEEEMHKVCCEHVNNGLAVIFNALLIINPDIEKQCRTIDAVVFEGEKKEGRLDMTKGNHNHKKTMELINDVISPELKKEILITKEVMDSQSIRNKKHENDIYEISMALNPAEVGLKLRTQINKEEDVRSVVEVIAVPVLSKKDVVSRINKMKEKCIDILYPKTELIIIPTQCKPKK